MTIDEAIKHAEEVANDMKLCCEECAEEHRQLAEWLRELKTYREQTDGDLISRQAVLEAYDEWRNGKGITYTNGLQRLRKQFEELPSAEKTDEDLIAEIDKLPRIKVGNSNSPTVKYCIDEILLYDLLDRYKAEKTAEWIFIQGYGTNHKSHYKCSNCDYKIGRFDIIFDYNFCPRCGARMEESEKEE